MKCSHNASPVILAVEMGYGHLRPAYALAEVFGTEVIRMDAPPIAGSMEAAVWKTARSFYNGLSRAYDWPTMRPAAKLILENITQIAPLNNHSTRQPANLSAYLADRLVGSFIGRRFRNMASWAGRPIIATYPVAALAARCVPDARVFCLATDTDLNRAWAPVKAEEAEIEYLAPVDQDAKRLRFFGIPDHRIHVTGFPLPPDLVKLAETALARRLRRLDPNQIFHRHADRKIAAIMGNSDTHFPVQPISVTVAIGGAGAQTRQADQILKSIRIQILSGKFKLTLVAGTRPEVASVLDETVRSAGLADCMGNGVRILLARDLGDYFRRFNECLTDTDVLWTKPSELVFFASLGLPVLLADPVGGQEHANRNWLLSLDAALDAGDPALFSHRLESLLATGEFCRIAWNAFSNLERNGSRRIKEVVDACGSGVWNENGQKMPAAMNRAES